MAKVLVLGTRNAKKRDELAATLQGLNLEIRDVTAYPNAPEVVEDGDTFLDNATTKAVETARAIGEWVLAEDSGLVVPALGGRPGVRSARFAGEPCDDEANNRLLIEQLTNVPEERRGAYYVCVVVISDPKGQVAASAEGRCHGRIVLEPRGTNGFGYDPLFLIPEYHRTFGELSPRVKQALSHRARAMERLRPALKKLFADPPV